MTMEKIDFIFFNMIDYTNIFVQILLRLLIFLLETGKLIFWFYRYRLWRTYIINISKWKLKKFDVIWQFQKIKIVKWLKFTMTDHKSKQMRVISVLSNESQSNSFGRCRSIFSTTPLGQIFAARFESSEVSESSERVEPERLLRAYSDRLIVHNWQGIKRTESKSKVGTLHFETWLFDERIRRTDELGVALERSDKWFDRFVHFFVYSAAMICLILKFLWMLYINTRYLIFSTMF